MSERIDLLDIKIETEYLEDLNTISGLRTTIELNPEIYNDQRDLSIYYEQFAWQTLHRLTDQDYFDLTGEELGSKVVFSGVYELDQYTPSQVFTLASVNPVDDFGRDHIYNKAALDVLDLQFSHSVKNLNGDNQAPEVDAVSLSEFFPEPRDEYDPSD